MLTGKVLGKEGRLGKGGVTLGIMHERGCQEEYLMLGEKKRRKHSRIQGRGGGVVPKGA